MLYTLPIPKIYEINANEFNKLKEMSFSGEAQLQDECLRQAPPKYLISYGGQTIYFSELYCESESTYPIVFAYVPHLDKLEPRLLYYSNSRALWRVAPGYMGHAFSKGNLGFTCDLPPELNAAFIQKFHKDISQEKFKSNSADPAFVRQFATISDDQYINSFHEATKPLLNIKNKTEDIPDYIFSENEILSELAKANVNMILPDFSKKLFEIKISNSFYSNVFCPTNKDVNDETNFYIFICPSYDKKYLFMYASVRDTTNPEKENATLTFLLTASIVPVELNSFCVSTRPLNLGYTTCFPIVHAADAAVKNYLKGQTKINFIFPLIDKESKYDYIHFERIAAILPFNRVDTIQSLHLSTQMKLNESFTLFSQPEVVIPQMSFAEQVENANNTKEILMQIHQKLTPNVVTLRGRCNNPQSISYQKNKELLDHCEEILEKGTKLLDSINQFLNPELSSNVNAPPTDYRVQLKNIVSSALENRKLTTPIKDILTEALTFLEKKSLIANKI